MTSNDNVTETIESMTKHLELLKKLNQLTDLDKLPKKLLDKISYTTLHSEVMISLKYESNKLVFVFTLHYPYELDGVKYLSIEEVEEAI